MSSWCFPLLLILLSDSYSILQLIILPPCIFVPRGLLPVDMSSTSCPSRNISLYLSYHNSFTLSNNLILSIQHLPHKLCNFSSSFSISVTSSSVSPVPVCYSHYTRSPSPSPIHCVAPLESQHCPIMTLPFLTSFRMNFHVGKPVCLSLLPLL